MSIYKMLLKKLWQNRLTLAITESVTAGYVSYLITKIPGSSKVFKGGFIVYSSEAKNKFLKIPLPLLKKNQGVSRKICQLLAKNTKKILNSDIAAAIVGFAGPQARSEIAVGTIYLGIAYKNNTEVKKIIITGNRDAIRKKAAYQLIELICKKLTAKTG